MTLPTVHAVVVNYNGCADTIECIESLLASDYPSIRALVLDNASTDGSIEKLGSWIREKAAEDRIALIDCGANLGFAGASNEGLRRAMALDPSGYMLLVNNDTTLAPNAVSEMVRLARRTPDLGAVGATILRHRHPEVVEMYAGATVRLATGMVTPLRAGADRRAERPSTVSLDYVSGCCLLTTAAAIAGVGLMDERYFLYSEDVDWGLRMRQCGLRLVYCSSAEVWHKGGSSVGHRSAVHDYYMVRAALMLVQKHAPSLLPYALAYWIWRGVLPKLARGQWDRLRASARGYRDFVRLWARSPVTAKTGLAPVP